MRELFIYYRVTPGHAALAEAAVRRMQAALRASHPGLQARLLRRAETQDGRQTWMEIYACSDAHGITPALQAAIADAAQPLCDWFDGPRHIEAFIACA